ncbi:iron ABC transporter permease [Rhodococcus opacus]|nr:iron ABC transporter permease [Rhodococcus opacus]
MREGAGDLHSGSLEGVRWDDVTLCAVVVFLGTAVCLHFAYVLDAFSFGDDVAASLGISVVSLRSENWPPRVARDCRLPVERRRAGVRGMYRGCRVREMKAAVSCLPVSGRMRETFHTN